MLVSNLIKPWLPPLNKGTFTWFSVSWYCTLVALAVAFYNIYIVLRSSLASKDEDETDIILVTGLFSSVYLFMCLFSIFWSTVLPHRATDCERSTANTHVIIAAHRAHDSLEIMLPSVLKTFKPEAIHIADNGFRDDATTNLCKRLGVNYHYNKVGNKCNALITVARKIANLEQDVKNVLLLDDDTLLDDSFFIRHDLLSIPRVGGYCVGIGVDRSPPFNLWEIAIDFEYRSISYAYGARAASSSSRFCHGIAAVYNLRLMLEIYQKNWALPGGLPFGEDGIAGLKFRLAGYRLMQDNENLALTYCPRQLFPPFCSTGRVQGYGANCLWKQRACRWYMNWPRRLPEELWLAVSYNAGTWYGNMSYRIYFVWWMFLNVISVLELYTVFVKEGWTWYIFIVVKGMLSGTAVFSALLKILVFPKKLRSGVHPLSPLCTPIFGLVVLILRLFGFMYSIFWYIPFVHLHEENLQIIDGDEEEDEEMNIAKEYEYQCTFIKSKSKSIVFTGNAHGEVGMKTAILDLPRQLWEIAKQAKETHQQKSQDDVGDFAASQFVQFIIKHHSKRLTSKEGTLTWWQENINVATSMVDAATSDTVSDSCSTNSTCEESYDESQRYNEEDEEMNIAKEYEYQCTFIKSKSKSIVFTGNAHGEVGMKTAILDLPRQLWEIAKQAKETHQQKSQDDVGDFAASQFVQFIIKHHSKRLTSKEGTLTWWQENINVATSMVDAATSDTVSDSCSTNSTCEESYDESQGYNDFLSYFYKLSE